jgi:hypothetical protein
VRVRRRTGERGGLGLLTQTVRADLPCANPASGLGVYDTANGSGSSSFCDTLIELGIVRGLDGWAQVGGTSLRCST